VNGTAVRVEGVCKRFGNHVAVEDVHFRVPAGVIYGVLGPNGAGKSTTLRMLNDIIAPDEGTIELLGGLKPGRESAPHVGFLPEERGLYPKMRVLEMVSFMGELRGLTGSDARARAARWLDRLGLGAWHRNKVQDLSKGMQQKVQFASALIHEPELVILDEPWSGLDPINADVLREVVREQKAAGHTVLFSTHLMEQAEQICEHVFIIARGKKVLDGRLVDVKREAAAHGHVALGFDGVDDAARAAPVLADRALCEPRGETGGAGALDVEVELATGVTSQALLVALTGVGVGLRRFERVIPSLHQIFVDRVGRHEAEVAARREDAA
jgi:ABC-2 type transport system ATP-binding protein